MPRLSQFKTAMVKGPKLEVNGETIPEGEELLHLHIAIAQEDRVVRLDTRLGGTVWRATAAATGIHAGPARAFGVAVDFGREPLAFTTFAWVEEIQVEDAATVADPP
jgi:hypothetical protein